MRGPSRFSLLAWHQPGQWRGPVIHVFLLLVSYIQSLHIRLVWTALDSLLYCNSPFVFGKWLDPLLNDSFGQQVASYVRAASSDCSYHDTLFWNMSLPRHVWTSCYVKLFLQHPACKWANAITQKGNRVFKSFITTVSQCADRNYRGLTGGRNGNRNVDGMLTEYQYLSAFSERGCELLLSLSCI